MPNRWIQSTFNYTHTLVWASQIPYGISSISEHCDHRIAEAFAGLQGFCDSTVPDHAAMCNSFYNDVSRLTLHWTWTNANSSVFSYLCYLQLILWWLPSGWVIYCIYSSTTLNNEWTVIHTGSQFLTDTKSKYATIEFPTLLPLKRLQPASPYPQQPLLGWNWKPHFQWLKSLLMAYNFTVKWILYLTLQWWHSCRIWPT